VNLKGYAMRVESSEVEIQPAKFVAMPENEGGGYIIGPVRASFVFLKKAKEETIAGQPTRLKYTLTALLPPGSPFKEIWEAAEAVIRSNMGEKLRAIPGGKIPETIRRGIRFVDKEVGYQGKAGFHPGWAFMSLITYETPPGVVNGQRQVVDAGLVVPGHWVKVRTKPFFYNNRQIGVSWGLNAVQLGFPDKRLDSRVDATAAFGDWEADGTTVPAANSPAAAELGNPWD
jgi:hypothetical protein